VKYNITGNLGLMFAAFKGGAGSAPSKYVPGFSIRIMLLLGQYVRIAFYLNVIVDENERR